MGGCVSVSISLDQLFNRFCANVNYLRNLDENIVALEKTTQELMATRSDLLTRIKIEEDGGRQLLHQVQVWLSRAEAIENQVDVLLRDRANQIQSLCLCGYCSKNFISSYRYGEKVLKMREEVDHLKSQAAFEAVTVEPPPPKVEKRPIQPIVGQQVMLETAWRHLMEDEVGILGLYGMGGVGKTTLLTQINNKFHGDKGGNFDIVIWVVVSKDMQIQRIQEEIGEKLGFNNEEWKQKKETRKKASDILNVLMRKRFVLLLDDLWEKVDLTEIGVPFPNRENGCKVIFTTRSKQVCGRMGVDVKMEIECLPPNEAWDLFRKKIGEITLRSHPDILELAETVATKCRGLPLALTVIGETMASKTMVQEWRHAVDVLTRSAAEFSGMEDEILPILKYSYDNLKGEKIKMCFQYCALFPEDYYIGKSELVDYWIGEGIIDGKEDIERGENEGYEIIGTLVRACLVMEENQQEVKMHDVIREMVLWVASDQGNQKENFIVKAGAKLRQMPKVKNWGVVKRMSLMRNRIEEISCSPQCPKLETLFLQDNELVKISGEFFQSMPRLRVLDLSWNVELTELPEEISELVSLQYLKLSGTKIKRLPVGLGKLKRLMYLNLQFTSCLESIRGISCLSSLRILGLWQSSVRVDVEEVKELQLLEHLKYLTIDMCVGSALEQFVSDQRLASCTWLLRIRDIEIESSVISLVANMDGLHQLDIENCVVPEIKVLALHEQAGPCFPNLRDVLLNRCKGMRDLTWLRYAPNLVALRVLDCRQVEEIISKEKGVGITGEEPNIIPFQRLESLYLDALPEMKSIYWTPLSFPCLSYIRVISCPKLRKLPFDSKSVPRADDDSFRTYVFPKEWVEGVEWEDDATLHRFFPIFRRQFESTDSSSPLG